MINIGVVIVTYNRLDKLKIALDLFDKQTYKPSYILVVDNASTDLTGDFLSKWKLEWSGVEKIVITASSNSGGSGGFYTGLEAAVKMDADWIWLSDDDAFPEKNALWEAADYLYEHRSSLNGISAVCGSVINHGKLDIVHRKNMFRRGLNIIEEYIPENKYADDSFELNCFSYVGTVVNKAKLKEAGLTKKEYFIWWDDTEHSLRLSKVGKIICVPSIRIHHDIGVSNAGSAKKTGYGFTWKTYYGFRNMADLIKCHFPGICYEYFCIKMLIKTYLQDALGKEKEWNKAVRCSLRDSRKGKLGIHQVYKPGWKPNK